MAAAQHGNGPNPERTKECVARIEAIAARKAAAHMDYMNVCSGLAEETAAVYDEAKKAWGINKRPLKAVIKTRALQRRLDDLRENLEDEDLETYDQVRHALGDLADTPLGGAALAGTPEGEADLRSPAQIKRAEAKARRNAALDVVSTDNGASSLASGLTQLNA